MQAIEEARAHDDIIVILALMMMSLDAGNRGEVVKMLGGGWS